MAMPYERFEAWRAAYALVLEVYRATEAFPKYELYGLTSQCRRAAFSIVANIAEGSAKRGKGEFRRFLDIGIGSSSELACLLRLSRDLGFLSAEEWEPLEAGRDRVGRLTWGLYRTLRT